MIDIVPYSADHKRLWNEFVGASRNGVFLFNREYMDYHADRFHDASLLFYADNKLVALMPANTEQDIFISHGGLTFGGIVTSGSVTQSLMIDVLDSLIAYLRSASYRTLVYKCIPHIYHSIPAEEDLYALHAKGARLYRRDVSSAIDLQQPPKLRKGRRYCISKASKSHVVVRETGDFKPYWELLGHTLGQRHGQKPVHTLAEMTLLRDRFPGHIRLYTALHGDTLVAGVVIYESTNVAHVQYMANSDEGRDRGALDLILYELTTDRYRHKKYFSFGISTVEEGTVLNAGLIAQKEGFGAHSVVHDFYKLPL